jgi:hypothetical protein
VIARPTPELITRGLGRMNTFHLPRRGSGGDDSCVPDDTPQSSDQPDETALLRAELAEARIAALEQIIKGRQRARAGVAHSERAG